MTPYERLFAAEEAFLVKSGWTKISENRWQEPERLALRRAMLAKHDPELPLADGPLRRTLPFGHALNSELLHGPECGSSTRAYMLHPAWEQYLLDSGWTREESDDRGSVVWVARRDGRKRLRATFKVAVNSQKQHDRTRFR